MKHNTCANRSFIVVAIFALVIGSYAPVTMPVRMAFAEEAPSDPSTGSGQDSGTPADPPADLPGTEQTGSQVTDGVAGTEGAPGPTAETLPEGETSNDPSGGDGSAAGSSPAAGVGAGGTADASGDSTSTTTDGSGSGDASGENGEGGAEAIAGEGANAQASEEGADANATGGGAGDAGAGGAGGVIGTGDAAAVVNLVNVINTTIVGSDGLLKILNIFLPFFGDVDTRLWGLPQSDCIGCLGALTVGNNNTAELTNNLSVSGETGQNSVAIGDLGADGGIFTGVANAAANILNIVNTNLVGSNYLLLVMNNFNAWNGDLVLPGKDFFTSIREQVLTGGSSLAVTNENTADIENSLTVEAGTGENVIADGSDGVIVTGDANAAANAVTVANQNFVGTAPVFILIRYFGNWTGNIFSPPPGISWQETPGGILLYDSPESALFSGVGQSGCCGGQDLTVENGNSAVIRNNVQVVALTGQNQISGGTGGVIETGNANAAANVVNIANTNIVGRNWVLAILNIFGDWNGNLAFGRPDLWIAEQADFPVNPVIPRSGVNYTLDIMNRGDADATQVVVEAETTPEGKLLVTDAGGGEITELGVRWTIPLLAAGESRTLTYSAQTHNVLPPGHGLVITSASIRSFETDNDLIDNSDALQIPIWGDTGAGLVERKGRFSRGFGTGSTPDITLTKTSNANGPVKPGDLVHYTVTIENTGEGSVWNAKLSDTLYDPMGKPLQTNRWDLDIIYPKEKVIVSYDNQFAPDAGSGWYVNRARLTGRDFFRDAVKETAGASVEVRRTEEPESPPPAEPEEEPEGEVLGAATCDAFLTDDLFIGLPNHREQVLRLQDFLNRVENAGIPMSGVYGTLTLEAVKKFQAKYADQILKPWENGDGEAVEPSGYVYRTTRRWMNMMNCATLDIPMPDLH